MTKYNMGENNPQWKGGKPRQDKDGYWYIFNPNHPNHNIDNRIAAHRLVYEHYLSILLDEEVFIPRNYEIHHITPVKEGGTDALINLQLVTHEEHRALHSKDKSTRFCSLCGNKTYINKKGHENWFVYQKKHICKKCYYRVKNPNNNIPINKRICIICSSNQSIDKNGNHWYGNKELGFKCKLCYDKESSKKRYRITMG